MSIPTAAGLPQDSPSLDPETRELVASYLEGGHVLVVAAGLTEDLISGEPWRTACGLATDGTYLWGLDVAYYVRTYGLEPSPQEFVARAVALGGRCLAVSQVRAAQVRSSITTAAPETPRSPAPVDAELDPFRG